MGLRSRIRISAGFAAPAALTMMVAALAAGCASTRAASTPQPGTGGSAVQHTAETGGGGGLAYQNSDGGYCPAASTDPAVEKLHAITAESALPKDFHAVAIVRCISEQRAVKGDGTWVFDIAQRATANLSGLVGLLREPDQSPSPNSQVACAAALLLVPAFGLVGPDGTVIRPRLPVTECGQPQPAVLAALNALSWKTETETKVTRVLTELEAATGCGPDYKYLPGFSPSLSHSAVPWSQVKHPRMSPITLVCAYRIDQSSYPAPEGTFTTGTKLTAQQAPGVQQAVDSASTPASAAPPCSARATRFAVLGSRDDLPYLVELDGCRRLVFPDYYLATAPPALLDLLARDGIK
jgi:hypothetical protein